VYFADNFQEFATLNAINEEIFKLHIFIESRQEFCFAIYFGFMLV